MMIVKKIQDHFFVIRDFTPHMGVLPHFSDLASYYSFQIHITTDYKGTQSSQEIISLHCPHLTLPSLVFERT